MEKTHNRLKGKNHKTEGENPSLLTGQTNERLEDKREFLLTGHGKWKELVTKNKRNNMKTKFRALIALLAVIFMFSCGALSKQKAKSSSTLNSALTNTESTSESSRLEFGEWQKVWMQQADYSTALIHSDSVISYHPEKGIQLTKGTLLLARKTQKEALSENSTFLNEEESTENSQNLQEQNQEKNSSSVSNKEKNSKINVICIGVIVLIISWLLSKTLKGAKCTK